MRKKEVREMRRIVEKFERIVDTCLSQFALAFAGGSVKLICYYIFHQPEMPEELRRLED